MSEKPILFSGPMVRAILEGRKTMTRRIVKGVTLHESGDYIADTKGRWMCDVASTGMLSCCPYGNRGDRLRVKEACWIWGSWRKNGVTKTGRQRWRFYEIEPRRVVYEKPEATAKRGGGEGWVYRHSRYMPRWASRLTLEVTAVRVERLMDITLSDVEREGAIECTTEINDVLPIWIKLWNSINGKRAPWESNPYVWVVSFKRVSNE